MYRLLLQTNGDFVALQLSGKLDASDYEGIVPILEARIAEHGKVRLYWEMRDFEGWTVGGLWSDTKFDVKHSHDFTRIAVVGEKKWHESVTVVMKPFTSAKLKYFGVEDRAAALAWAQE